MPTFRIARVSVTAAAAAVVAAAPFAAGGAADTARSAAAVPTVRVTPSVVQRGQTITVTGRGWRRNAVVDLLIGPPRSEGTHVGRARTSSTGTFRRRLPISSKRATGRWVLLACRRDCRIKAVKSFRVTR